jgi:hypothetical protein
MTVPALSPYRLSFLLAVPLAWAVLLMFHPAPDPSDIYGSLRDESTQWLVVHIGTLLFIGLMGAALFLLVSGLPGLAAKVSRVAAGAFVLCYGAAEAILGIAAGVLVRYGNVAPENERAGVAAAIQSLWDDMISADLAATVGASPWRLGSSAPRSPCARPARRWRFRCCWPCQRLLFCTGHRSDRSVWCSLPPRLRY